MSLPDEIRELVKEEVKKSFDKIKEEVLSEVRKMFNSPNIGDYVNISAKIKEKILSNDEIIFMFKVHLGFLEKLTYLNIFSPETISLWNSRGIDLEKTLENICKVLEKKKVATVRQNPRGLKYVVFITKDFDEAIKKFEIDEMKEMMESLEILVRNEDDILLDWKKLFSKGLIRAVKKGNYFEVLFEGSKVVIVPKNERKVYSAFKEAGIRIDVSPEEISNILRYLEYLSETQKDDEALEFITYWINEIKSFKRVDSISKIKENPINYLYVKGNRVYISSDVEKRIKRIMGITSKVSKFFEKVGIIQKETMSLLGSYVRVFDRASLESYIRRFFPDFSFDSLPTPSEEEIVEEYVPDIIEKEVESLGEKNNSN